MSKSDDLKVLVEDLRLQREALEKREKKLVARKNELEEKLSKVGKMTVEEAKKELLDEVQRDITSEVAKKIRAAEEKGNQAESMSLRADMMMTTPAPGPHRKLNLSG